MIRHPAWLQFLFFSGLALHPTLVFLFFVLIEKCDEESWILIAMNVTHLVSSFITNSSTCEWIKIFIKNNIECLQTHAAQSQWCAPASHFIPFTAWACTPWPSSLSVRCSEEKENNFYSSDSDFDDEEPKKFHIQIRPVASSNRSSSAATEKELKATIGALTLPPNRGARQQVELVVFFFLSCSVCLWLFC